MRRRVPAAPWSRGTAAIVLALLAGATLTGCIIDPAVATMTVENETGVELAIMHEGDHLQTVRPGTRISFALGRGDGCFEWTLEAVTDDDVVVAVRKGPACHTDEWTITSGSRT